jgi:putative methanogenesis marker protein 17
MKALEYFEVECTEELGGQVYKKIAADILQDLDLIKTIGRLHIYIDPAVPIFLAVGLTRKLPRIVRVDDFANVLEQGGKVTLDIGDETYLSYLLNVLWERFGRDIVEQPDRWTVVIKTEEAKADEIENMVVFDPSTTMNKDLIYALSYIAPEGFKIRRQYIEKNRFYYVASENTLPEDIVESLIAQKFALIGVTW